MEIRPYTGITETLISHLRENLTRKIEGPKKEDHSYNVKPISEVHQTGDRKEFNQNNTPTTKQGRIAEAYNPSPEEFYGRAIDISI